MKLRITVTGALLVAAAVVVTVPVITLRAEGPYSFPHAPHLSAATVDRGLAFAADRGDPDDSECRVCHDYTGGEETHLSGCAQCHQDDAHLVVERAAPHGPRTPFPHASHLRDESITCFDCHRMKVEYDWVEFSVPAGGLGPRGHGGSPGGALGTRTCADCHAEHEPAGGLVTQDGVTGDGRRCAACHQGATSILPQRYRAARSTAAGVRPFLHADHGGAAAECDDCHAGIRASQTIWDYDPATDTRDRCSACHVADAAGTALAGVATPARTSKLPYVAFDRFPHSAHLVPAGTVETSGAVTAGCRTCHFPETDAAAASLFPLRSGSGRGSGSNSTEPVGRAELIEYRACAPCHATWSVANHGVGAWACFKCHSGDLEADGALAVATARVERDDVEAVAFGVHAHPGVTTNGAVLVDDSQPDGKTCSDCHVADNETVPSRLTGRTFDHAPHVSDLPTSAECLGCHATAATTSWSEDLSRFDTHVERVGPARAGIDPRGCLDCHAGALPGELGVRRVSAVVPQFDHRSHASAKTYIGAPDGIPCTTCHEPGGDTGYHVPADVADCTRCHGHDPADTQKFGRTGVAASREEATRCAHCHGGAWPVGDAAPAHQPRTRVHIDLLPGTQWHDRTGACAACHERSSSASGSSYQQGSSYQEGSAYQERITRAKVTSSIHDDPQFADAWFNDPRIDKPEGDPGGQGRTCMTCHRREPRGYLRNLGE